jgi:hypothetical protein
MEMTPAQARALKLYCSSATLQNDYYPMTFEEIAKKLSEEGLQGSSSSVQRWSVKFDFKSHLEAQIQLAIIDGGDAKSLALKKIDSKKAVDIVRNNELTSDGYEVLETYVSNVLDRMDKSQAIGLKEIQLVKDIVILTSGREDKLLDRLAGMGGEKLSSEDLKREFASIDMDIEE